MERSASAINSYSLKEREGEEEETLSVPPLPLSHCLLSSLLRAEYIRNVTWDEGRKRMKRWRGVKGTNGSKSGFKCYH